MFISYRLIVTSFRMDSINILVQERIDFMNELNRWRDRGENGWLLTLSSCFKLKLADTCQAGKGELKGKRVCTRNSSSHSIKGANVCCGSKPNNLRPLPVYEERSSASSIFIFLLNRNKNRIDARSWVSALCAALIFHYNNHCLYYVQFKLIQAYIMIQFRFDATQFSRNCCYCCIY